MPQVREAERLKDIAFSGIRKVFEKIGELESKGQSVINLCIGRPDFDTPSHIKEGAIRALREGQVHYTSNSGLLELREAIASRLSADFGIEPDPGSEIMVTAGTTEAVFLGMTAYLNPGDEVIVPTPAWPVYEACARLAGARPVPVILKESNSFSLSVEDIEEQITSKTKMIVINTPQNPTGCVTEAETLEAVIELAAEKGILILSDEIYSRLVYGDTTTYTAALDKGWENTITVDGLSKSYSMTGWRLGFVMAPEELIGPMLKIHQNTAVCATSFAQYGGIEALTSDQGCVTEMRDEFDSRRKLLIEGLNSLPGVECVPPLGAFYAFPSIKGLKMSSEEASDLFLELGVGVVPGTAFGPGGEGYLRVAYSNSYQNIERAIALLKEGLSKRV